MIDRPIIRILARKVHLSRHRPPGPDKGELPMKWLGILMDTGEVLTGLTEYPLTEGAAVLMRRGLDPGTLVTMRHEGCPDDSFPPMPLEIAAREKEGETHEHR